MISDEFCSFYPRLFIQYLKEGRLNGVNRSAVKQPKI